MYLQNTRQRFGSTSEVRNNEDFYHLDKATKGCSATVVAGTEEEVLDYINKNNLKMVELLHI